MLHLRVFGSAHAMVEVAEALSVLGGARHITRTATGHRTGAVIVTADLHADAADAALHCLRRLGVRTDDFALLRLDAIQPLRRHPHAGMLALETRASSAVGVAISVTTIPASAYLGVAAAVGEAEKAAGAAAVLGVNVVMLAVGGTGALLVQRALGRRAARVAGSA